MNYLGVIFASSFAIFAFNASISVSVTQQDRPPNRTWLRFFSKSLLCLLQILNFIKDVIYVFFFPHASLFTRIVLCVALVFPFVTNIFIFMVMGGFAGIKYAITHYFGVAALTKRHKPSFELMSHGVQAIF